MAFTEEDVLAYEKQLASSRVEVPTDASPTVNYDTPNLPQSTQYKKTDAPIDASRYSTMVKTPDDGKGFSTQYAQPKKQELPTNTRPSNLSEYLGLSEVDPANPFNDKQLKGYKEREEREARRASNIMSLKPKADYKSPENTFEKFTDMVRSGFYLPHAFRSFVIPSIGTSFEQLGIVNNSTMIRNFGERFYDRQYESAMRSRAGQSAADTPGALEGGLKDPRFYAHTISNTMAFFGTVLAASALGGLVAGPVGAKALGFLTIQQMEANSMFRELIKEGHNPKEAVLASQVYGVGSAYIETAIGLDPTSGVGGVTKDFAKRGAAGKVFSAVKVMIEEGIVEEGAQEILSNLVTRTFDANTGVFDNLVETMISGVVGSIPFGVGAALGGSSSGGDISSITPKDSKGKTTDSTQVKNKRPTPQLQIETTPSETTTTKQDINIPVDPPIRVADIPGDVVDGLLSLPSDYSRVAPVVSEKLTKFLRSPAHIETLQGELSQLIVDAEDAASSKNTSPNILEHVQRELEYLKRVLAGVSMVKDSMLEVGKYSKQTAQVKPKKIFEDEGPNRPGHNKLNAYLEQMVANETLEPVEAEILQALYAESDDAILARTDFIDDRNLRRPLGRYSAHQVAGEYVTPGTETVRIKRRLSQMSMSTSNPGLVTVIHEFAHLGYYGILTAEERAIVEKVYNDLSKEENRSLFEGINQVPGYASTNAQEFFAESMPQYVLENKVPAKEMESLLRRASKVFFNRMKRLFNRKTPKTIETLAPLFEKILKGDPSTPFTEFAKSEPPSFKKELQVMMDSLSSEHIAYQEMQDDMTSKALPNAGEEKSLFDKKRKEGYYSPDSLEDTMADVPLFKEKVGKPDAGVTAETGSESSINASIFEKGKKDKYTPLFDTDQGTALEQADKFHERMSLDNVDIEVPTLEEVLEDDISVPMNERIGLLDYLRTPMKVFEKMGIRPAYNEILKAYENYHKELPKNIEQIGKWAETVSDNKESNRNIFRFLNGDEDIVLSEKEAAVAAEIRNVLDDWADRLDIPHDLRISDYITRLFPKGMTKNEIPPEVAIYIDKKLPKGVFNPFMLARTGKEGYLEDTWKALDAYTKVATRKVHMDPAIEFLKIESAKLNDVSQLRYVSKYMDNLNNRPSNLDVLLDNTFRQVFGDTFGTRPTHRFTSNVRMMISRAKIGLSITSFAKNITQGVNTFAELGAKYTTRGYMDLAKFGAKELNENGVLMESFIEERIVSATKTMVNKMDAVLFYNMKASEQINRGAAYYGAKAKFLEGKITAREFRQALGKDMPANYSPTMEDATSYGKYVSAKTQFLFGPVDTQLGLSSDVAKAATQFSTFGIKQAEFIAGMANKQDAVKLTRYVASSMLIFGTIGTAFGMNWDDSFKTFRFGYPPMFQFFYELFLGGILGVDNYGNAVDAKGRASLVGKSLFANVMPAGAQLSRSYQGYQAVDEGKVLTDAGNLRYKVADSPENYVRGTLFGRSNLPETQAYYKKVKADKKKRNKKGKSKY